MIVYGILAEQSVSRLFAAGVLPGLMIAGLYSAYIILRAKLTPEIAPHDKPDHKLADFGRALVDLLPLGVLMGIVLGSIYTGIATPSEAARGGGELGQFAADLRPGPSHRFPEAAVAIGDPADPRSGPRFRSRRA